MTKQYLWDKVADDFITNGDATKFHPVFANFQKSYPVFKDLDLA